MKMKEMESFRNFFETAYGYYTGHSILSKTNFFYHHDHLDHYVSTEIELKPNTKEVLEYIKKLQNTFQNLSFREFIIELSQYNKEVDELLTEMEEKRKSSLYKKGKIRFPILPMILNKHKEFRKMLFNLDDVIQPRIQEIKENLKGKSLGRENIGDSFFVLEPTEWAKVFGRYLKDIKKSSERNTMIGIIQSVLTDIKKDRKLNKHNEVKSMISFYNEWLKDQRKKPLEKIVVKKTNEQILSALESFNKVEQNRGTIKKDDIYIKDNIFIKTPQRFINKHIQFVGESEDHKNENYTLIIKTKIKKQVSNEQLTRIADYIKPYIKNKTIDLTNEKLGEYVQRILIENGYRVTDYQIEQFIQKHQKK